MNGAQRSIAGLAFGQLCQAHRTHAADCTLPTRQDGEVYRLCRQALRRLRAGRLRPLEVFNLISLHGLEPGGYLGSSQRIYHRYQPSGRPERWSPLNLHLWFYAPEPRLRRYETDIGRLLDCAALHFVDLDELSDSDVEAGLRDVAFEDLFAEIRARVAGGVPSAALYAYYRVIGMVGTPAAADWVRGRWDAGVCPDLLGGIVRASHACLPEEERVERCLATIERFGDLRRLFANTAVSWLAEGLSTDRALEACFLYLRMIRKRDLPRVSCYVLADRGGETVLDWMERNVFDPDQIDSSEMLPDPENPIFTAPCFDDWGQLASACRPSWQRLAGWLGQGPPLSRVAIDALLACGAINREELSGSILRRHRGLRTPGERDRMTRVLRAYAETDPDLRVRMAVQEIVANWDRVIEGAPQE